MRSMKRRCSLTKKKRAKGLYLGKNAQWRILAGAGKKDHPGDAGGGSVLEGNHIFASRT